MKNINVMPANANNNNEMQEPKLVARKRKVNPFSTVIRKANSLYSKQVSKNTAVKQACIMACILPCILTLTIFGWNISIWLIESSIADDLKRFVMSVD